MTPTSQPIYIFSYYAVLATLHSRYRRASCPKQCLHQQNLRFMTLNYAIKIAPVLSTVIEKTICWGLYASLLSAFECSIRQQNNNFARIKRSYQILNFMLKDQRFFFLTSCSPQNILDLAYPIQLFVSIKLQWIIAVIFMTLQIVTWRGYYLNNLSLLHTDQYWLLSWRLE